MKISIKNIKLSHFPQRKGITMSKLREYNKPRHWGRKRVKRWRGLWWKDPKYIYRGDIKMAPKNPNSPGFRWWKRCAWALIYNPKTPEWLRILLQSKMFKKRYKFDKKLFRTFKWRQTFFTRWARNNPRPPMARKFNRGKRIERYQLMYNTYKTFGKYKSESIMFGLRAVRLYWSLYRILGSKRYTGNKTPVRRKFKDKPSVKNTIGTHNFYTMQYIRRRQVDFFINNRFSDRNVVFSNRVPLKIFKNFLSYMHNKSWSFCLNNFKLNIFNLIYRYNLGMSRHKIYSLVAKGLLTINNTQINFQKSLSYSDVISVSHKALIIRKSWSAWGISQSWVYWLKILINHNNKYIKSFNNIKYYNSQQKGRLIVKNRFSRNKFIYPKYTLYTKKSCTIASDTWGTLLHNKTKFLPIGSSYEYKTWKGKFIWYLKIPGKIKFKTKVPYKGLKLFIYNSNIKLLND